MNELILVGAGGCMRELLWQIREQNRRGNGWKVVGIIDKVKEDGVAIIDGVRILGDDSYLLGCKKLVNVAICVGNSQLRKKIVENLSQNSNIHFPIIKLSDNPVAENAILGQGTIISKGCTVSIDAKIGEFVFVNMNTTICHEATLEDFVTLSPCVNLAGNVTIERESEVGIGATILPGIHIGANCIVGAGAVVVKDVPRNCTAVGVPARPTNATHLSFVD